MKNLDWLLKLKDVVFQMDEMMEKYNGIGISAIQIGIPWRIFLAGRPSELFINPRMVEKSSITKQDWEGCLSCPDLKVRVRRSHSVVMEYHTFNESGEYISVKRKFKGFDARVVQHEFDHLNGILITDKGKVVPTCYTGMGVALFKGRRMNLINNSRH